MVAVTTVPDTKARSAGCEQEILLSNPLEKYFLALDLKSRLFKRKTVRILRRKSQGVEDSLSFHGLQSVLLF